MIFGIGLFLLVFCFSVVLTQPQWLEKDALGNYPPPNSWFELCVIGGVIIGFIMMLVSLCMVAARYMP